MTLPTAGAEMSLFSVCYCRLSQSARKDEKVSVSCEPKAENSAGVLFCSLSSIIGSSQHFLVWPAFIS